MNTLLLTRVDFGPSHEVQFREDQINPQGKNMKRNTSLDGLVATLIRDTAMYASAASQVGACQTPAPHTQSSRDLLLLSDGQASKLEQLWEYASSVRADNERQLAKKGGKATVRDRQKARKKNVGAFVKAQVEAAKLLLPSQGPLLDACRQQLRLVHAYGAKQLFTWSVEEFLASPVDKDAARRWLVL